MKELFQDMIRASENNNLAEFDRLNNVFNQYDLLRQSCLCTFQFPDYHEEALTDTKRRFEELKRLELI